MTPTKQHTASVNNDLNYDHHVIPPSEFERLFPDELALWCLYRAGYYQEPQATKPAVTPQCSPLPVLASGRISVTKNGSQYIARIGKRQAKASTEIDSLLKLHKTYTSACLPIPVDLLQFTDRAAQQYIR